MKTFALGKQKTGVRLSYRWRCTLARGTYRWTVGAVDLAGNRQVKTGVNTLIVR